MNGKGGEIVKGAKSMDLSPTEALKTSFYSTVLKKTKKPSIPKQAK